ncbi:MAG: DsbE family thiol:disulfide interchange protein [Bauldia sp.]|nr:DsbE family thiol:disulfide interchange protein [Bauldia sp.]
MPEGATGGTTQPPRSSARRRWVVIIPLVLFAVLAAVFLLRLESVSDPSLIPSALIGNPAPEMDLPPLEGLAVNGVQLPGLSDDDLRGAVTLVNVWGSWCPPCRQEHPYLMALAQDDRFRIVGINYKDDGANALGFLDELGNPYDAVGVDRSGRNAIDWGVYAAPETFLVDREGVIRQKIIGPVGLVITLDALMASIEALLDEPAPAPADDPDA